MQYLHQAPSSMREVAGYTLIQRARATDTNRIGGCDPRVEIWHTATDRLLYVAPRWLEAIEWAEARPLVAHPPRP